MQDATLAIPGWWFWKYHVATTFAEVKVAKQT